MYECINNHDVKYIYIYSWYQSYIKRLYSGVHVL